MVAAEPKRLFGLVVLQPPRGADGEGEFRAEVDGGVGGFEAAQPEDEAAVLDAEVEAEGGDAVAGVREGGGVGVGVVGGGGGREEVRGGDGAGGPGWVGGVVRRAFEEGEGFREGLGEEAELGGEELCGGRVGAGGGAGGGARWGVGGGVGVGEGDAEEVDGLGEEGVEGGEGGEVDGVVGVDGEGLGGEGAQADVDCLLGPVSVGG